MDFGLYSISLNFENISDFFAQGTGEVIFGLFVIFGWVIIASLLLTIGIRFYRDYRENKYTADWKWVVLAIDIPALNIQTPKAVEQMFAHLAGAFDQPDIANAFRGGYKQRWFSLEIISIGGYIQFLIRTEEKFRDLVETSIYAQYPEAEVIEVEDYVTAVPDKFPDNDYDIWASDFGLSENDAYPIRFYGEFEHSISKDTVLKDPMGTFLESFSRIGSGEQMWFQIIIEPTSNDWKEKAIQKIREMMGDESSSKGIFPAFKFEELGKSWSELNSQLLGSPSAEGEESSIKEKTKKNMLDITPGQSKLIAGMEEKISKIGFKTKMRGVYIARKEVFRPERGVNAMIGAINQFNVPSSNSIVPNFGISASYFLKDKRIIYRKNLLMKAYKKRKLKVGSNPFILNTEELATVWHFPMSHVKTPLLQKSQAKSSEPPSGLPVEFIADIFEPQIPTLKEKKKTSGYMTDAGYMSGDEDVKFG
ncbi:MAG: hypothetical protein ABIJ23_03340 [Candidatus Magasanikbacteria bacterium]